MYYSCFCPYGHHQKTRLQLHKLIHTKPNSSTPNQTHPYKTKLNCTKPNTSIPNQTKSDNSQPNLTNPNWLSMHSRTISSFSLLLALVFALVILQNCDSLTHSLSNICLCQLSKPKI